MLSSKCIYKTKNAAFKYTVYVGLGMPLLQYL